MANDLEALILACISKKDGNKEFALYFFDHDFTFRASIGNTCAHTLIGESEAEITAEGRTATEAVERLYEALHTT